MSTDPTKVDLRTDPLTQRMSGRTVHKNMWFDVPFITEVGDNLFQGGCENGLVLPPNIKHLVSLYKWEAYTVNHELDSSLTVTMYDSEQAPVVGEQVAELAGWINVCRATGPVLVHCQAGLNRSSLLAATALVFNGDCETAEEAIAHLREVRSPAVLCNQVFEDWLLTYIDPVMNGYIRSE